MPTLIDQAKAREWFYAYELPDGSVTPTYHDIDVQAIHDMRCQMVQACIDETGDMHGRETSIAGICLVSMPRGVAVDSAGCRIFAC